MYFLLWLLAVVLVIAGIMAPSVARCCGASPSSSSGLLVGPAASASSDDGPLARTGRRESTTRWERTAIARRPWTSPPAPQSAGRPRRFVQAQLDDWDLRVDDDGVVLMVQRNRDQRRPARQQRRQGAPGRPGRLPAHRGDRHEHDAGCSCARADRVRDRPRVADRRRPGRPVGRRCQPDGKTVWFEVVVPPDGDVG